MGIFVWPCLLDAFGVKSHGLGAHLDLALLQETLTMALPLQHLVQEQLPVLRNQVLTQGP